MKMIHGGDIQGYQEEYGKKPLDYSANISPLGLPEAVRESLITALDRTEEYPDPICRKLRKKIGEEIQQPMEYIICGNGAADLIYRLVYAHKPKKALVLAPTFAEYEEALQSIGCEVIYYHLKKENGFQVTEDILDDITDEIDILFLCQPNNPTGVLCEKPLLEKLLAHGIEHQVLVAIDECFVSFLEEPQRYTMIEYIQKTPSLFILKAFTKIYAMAGIRLGYGVSSNRLLLEKMGNAGQPWNVSLLAQEAGCVAIEQKAYVEEVKQVINEQRPLLIKELEQLGMIVYHGRANYILFYTEDIRLHHKLRTQGILIRDCSNYKGLKAGYYRIAVRDVKDNKKFITQLKKALNNETEKE